MRLASQTNFHIRPPRLGGPLVSARHRNVLAFLILVLALATLGHGSDNPKRVLILNPYARETEPYSAAISAFRSTLGREIGGPLALEEIPLDLARFTEEGGEEPLVAFLAERLQRQSADLVVPVGSSSMRFVDRHRGRLFPNVPVLVIGGEPRFIPPGFLENNATLVSQKIDAAAKVEDMLELQPDTERIAVVFGSSPLEKHWVAECQREFQRFSGRVEFLWLNDLPMEEILDRCSKLPPRSSILHGLFLDDVQGIPIEKNEALRRLHEQANAPLFAYFMSELGLGPVGGRLIQNSEMGARGARVAVRILRGEKAGDIPPEFLDTGMPAYDWRELKRWKIPEARLPAGSVIHFREAGFWERYRWPAIGTILLALFQATLIAGLLVNRTKRRAQEAEATLIAEISSKFVNLPASEVDRAIFDAERRICELMNIDVIVLWQWSDHSPGSFTATHFYSLEHGPQVPNDLMDDDFPWVKQEIVVGHEVTFRSWDEMPAAAARDRVASEKAGVKSAMNLPLSLGGEIPIGIICFNTTRKERSWSPAQSERLRLVAETFANALARKKADQELHESEERNRLALEQTMDLRETLAHSGRVTLLGQLASALAHELSQPLGAILRNAEAAEIMLQNAAPDLEELRAIVDDILRDDHRAGEVINKLRSLLKKGHLDLQALDLSGMINEVLALLASDANDRQVKLTFDSAPNLPMVSGDRIHLQQVLLNVIVNAMDALKGVRDHERSVHVRACQIDATTAEVSICDNGPGISDEHLGSLFEPFFTTKSNGMGMGLAVSKTIIEAHKGTLRAENRTEGGACFRFTLPTILPS